MELSKDSIYINWRRYLFSLLLVTLFFLILGGLMLPLSTSHLYGIYLGVGLCWISIFFIILGFNIVTKFIKSPKAKIWSYFAVFVIVRYTFFIIAMIVSVILLNNESIALEKEVKLILEPINIFFVTIGYQTLAVSLVIGNFIKI